MCCTAPTCADDVALITSMESGEMSTILNTIETHANLDRLTINSSKSVVLQYPAGHNSPSVDLQIHGCALNSEPTATHFGVLRGAARTINTQQIGTGTVWQKWFQPHGVGQEMDHLHPSTAATRCRALVPQQHKHKHFGEVPGGSTKTTTWTSSKSIKLCYRSLPIEAEIDRNFLTFFRNIIKDKKQFRV